MRGTACSAGSLVVIFQAVWRRETDLEARAPLRAETFAAGSRSEASLRALVASWSLFDFAISPRISVALAGEPARRSLRASARVEPSCFSSRTSRVRLPLSSESMLRPY